MSKQGTENSILRVIFKIGSNIITSIILQNNIFRFNLCPIERFYSWVCYFGEPQKTRTLMTVTAGNRTQLFQTCLSNWLCIITTIILQNNIARFSLCPIESFHSWVLYFGEPRRTKTLITVAAGNRTQLFHIIFRNGLTLSPHWFYKITFLDSAYVQLKVFIAECVTLESHKKQKHWWKLQHGTENRMFRVFYRIGFDIISSIIL